jgi:hypothetical protein
MFLGYDSSHHMPPNETTNHADATASDMEAQYYSPLMFHDPLLEPTPMDHTGDRA